MTASEGKTQVVAAPLPSIYVAAHELKAPLVLMRQLSLELQHASGAHDTQTIERLVLSVERSLRLVEQLTRTARLEGAMFDSEPLHAEAVCKAVAYELQPFARASDQRIVTRTSRRSVVAVGHRSLLTALLVNLCDNAISHNPRGGKVELSATAREHGVEFSVRDYGPSMSHATFQGIREQLGKGPLPVSDRPRSSGLGLWIAGQFAEVMDGRLTMTRHHAAGITVSVTLPYSKQLSLL